MAELWEDYRHPFEFVSHAQRVTDEGGTLSFEFWSRAADVMIDDIDAPGSAIFYTRSGNMDTWGGTGSNDASLINQTTFGMFFSTHRDSYINAVSEEFNVDFEFARDNIVFGTDAENTASVWARGSEKFATSASGRAYVLLGPDAPTTQAFGAVELPSLLSNESSVTHINGIEISTLRAVFADSGADGVFDALRSSTDSFSELLADGKISYSQYETAIDIAEQSADVTIRGTSVYISRELYDAGRAIETNTTNYSYDDVKQILVDADKLAIAAGVGVVATDVLLFAAVLYSYEELAKSDPAEANSYLTRELSGMAGGAAGGYLAVAAALVAAPELATTTVGLVMLTLIAISGDIAGSDLGEGLASTIMSILSGDGTDAEKAAQIEAVTRNFIEGNDLNFEGVSTLRVGDKLYLGNECFSAGTEISIWDGTQKTIEDIGPGDIVHSYDERGTIVPGRIRRTFQNEVSHLLDVHGLKVTPGHVTLCGDGPFSGRHVPIIDILLSDGALVKENGDLVRMAINKPVGSVEDQFVEVGYAVNSDAARSGDLKSGQMRVGTLLFDQDGQPVSVLDCIEAEGMRFDPNTGLVSKPHGPPEPLYFFGELPRPEDYILRRSRETLEGILTDDEWEGTPSQLVAQRLRQTQSMKLH